MFALTETSFTPTFVEKIASINIYTGLQNFGVRNSPEREYDLYGGVWVAKSESKVHFVPTNFYNNHKLYFSGQK